MTYSTIGSEIVAAALARQVSGSGMAIGVASAHSRESIEAMAKQLGAQVATASSQDGPSAEVMIVAVLFRAHSGLGDQLSDSDRKVAADALDNDSISPDALMGLLNAAR